MQMTRFSIDDSLFFLRSIRRCPTLAEPVPCVNLIADRLMRQFGHSD